MTDPAYSPAPQLGNVKTVKIPLAIPELSESRTSGVFDQCLIVALPAKGILLGAIDFIVACRIAGFQQTGLNRAMRSVAFRAGFGRMHHLVNFRLLAKVSRHILQGSIIGLNGQVMTGQATFGHILP